LGAYYTDSQIAEFLVWWAVRSGSDTVLDPSFGGGVFLHSACSRLWDLGGNPSTQVFGIELDPTVHGRVSEKLNHEFGLAPGNLRQHDFFDVTPERLPRFDVVVGNPPFIRYQRFNGNVRKRALMRAAEQGLKLSELSSSWVPFLVHSLGFLRAGGRLAMVIPFEIGHAAYARPVLRHLSGLFQELTFLTFRKKLFRDLSEDTLLLLADGKEVRARCRVHLRDFAHAGELAAIQQANRRPVPALHTLDGRKFASGQQRIIEYMLPRDVRDLYHRLRTEGQTLRLGELTDVGIGYVTGANSFFHLGPEAVREWGIPNQFLRPCIRRGRLFAGLRFTKQDWRNALEQGEAGYLLLLPAKHDLPESVLRYLEHGETLGVHHAFKCRTRDPWYRVPHVHDPDAFLTYMSGGAPKLVANDAGVVAPNTLHILRLQPTFQTTRHSIAALWHTSLARLSAEIEGHSLGGGMLKLEPTEAEDVLLPFPNNAPDLESLARELDSVSRARGDAFSERLADRHLLQGGLGLSASDCNLLRAAADMLHARRLCRN
jgi:hypothetical protein